MRLHLETCDECRALIEADRALLAELATLPAFAPRAGFADRVMARVRVAQPGRIELIEGSLSRRPRLALAATLLLLLGGSVWWSAANRVLLQSWIDGAAVELGRSLWLGFRGLMATLIEQPWFTTARNYFVVPGRAIAVAGGGLVACLTALIAFRRLVTPTGVVTHASR